jgi:PAS domain S-box-containing protein
MERVMKKTDEHSIIANITLEQTLGTIPSGLFVVDKEMRITYWNPAAERITGFSVEDAVGRHCSFLQGVPCGDGCGLYNPEVIKPIIGAQCTIVTKSAKIIHLLKNMDYLRDSAGEIIGGIESFIDITRQQTLEDSLREQTATLEAGIKERTAELKKSEARFRTVLENMDDLAYIATEGYILTFMNRSMREIFGDRTGERCHEVLHNERAVCSWCPMSKVFKQRTVRDERQLGHQGRLYEIIHTPLPDEDGLQQKLAVCRDITERKKTETDLREANRELDAFAHSISHDLRGILAPVVTYMDLLQNTYGKVFDDQVMQILSEVERQSERAIALLDDLLDLAQVGHVTPAQYPTEVSKVVDEIINELLREECGSREFIKEKLLETWVPETLVYQIFANLIRNACHYVPLESGAVAVGCWEEKQNVIYFVRDHGPGISHNEREAIFDIFYRGKNAMGQQRGTGVGLAIVRKAALRCGGEVWVEQTPGGGATFCVSLPKTSTFGTPPEGGP